MGAESLQDYCTEIEQLGFNPEDEIEYDTRFKKVSMFGNNMSSEALGKAMVNTGIHGPEQTLEAHVLEGRTPLLLSSTWLYEQRAIIGFGSGQAPFPLVSSNVIQLERAPTYHLLLPVTALGGNETAKGVTTLTADADGPLLRACAQLEDASEKVVPPE